MIYIEVPVDDFGQPKRDDRYDLAKIRERAKLEMITNCPVEDQWSPKKYDFREALTRTRDLIQSVL